MAPALWAWLQEADVELQVSAAPVPGSTPTRKALEAVAIAQHRQRHGRSPRWNFGRMPAGFSMSSANNARLVAAGKRFRGDRTEAELAAHVLGVPPSGGLDSDVEAATWCGHAWSAWLPMNAGELQRLTEATGLYRLRGRCPGLVYVGEGKVRDRLRAHAHKLGHQTQQGQVLAACAPLEFSTVLDNAWLQHQRLELETDLIGAHTLALGDPPAAQFIG